SLTFAVVIALLATGMLFPGIKWREGRWRVALVLGIAILSHSTLDALSHYSYGIEFFAPFSAQRYRFLWTPLGDPEGRLSHQLLQEALVVLLPALVAVWVGLRVKRAR
ncbi:MAG TPA: metal-dependent hydrolase, partial [Gemmatimonadales bacterium]|nr:metal-dependent hydrolase [Gemmatimonadales bacterium]